LFARFGTDMDSRTLYGFRYPQPKVSLREICKFDRVA